MCERVVCRWYTDNPQDSSVRRRTMATSWSFVLSSSATEAGPGSLPSPPTAATAPLAAATVSVGIAVAVTPAVAAAATTASPGSAVPARVRGAGGGAAAASGFASVHALRACPLSQHDAQDGWVCQRGRLRRGTTAHHIATPAPRTSVTPPRARSRGSLPAWLRTLTLAPCLRSASKTCTCPLAAAARGS